MGRWLSFKNKFEAVVDIDELILRPVIAFVVNVYLNWMGRLCGAWVCNAHHCKGNDVTLKVALRESIFNRKDLIEICRHLRPPQIHISTGLFYISVLVNPQLIRESQLKDPLRAE